MFIDLTKRLVHSDNPSLIEWLVQQAVETGEDLCEAPFIFNGEFGQWVTRRESLFVYKLVSAHSMSAFESEVRRMNADGYETAFNQVDWDGLLCQWMAKPKGLGVEAKDAAVYAGAVLPVGGAVAPMPGFRLVAGGQVLGEIPSFGFLPRNERSTAIERVVEIARGSLDAGMGLRAFS